MFVRLVFCRNEEGMQSSKKNGTAIEGRGDRRVGLNTSGREECTPRSPDL